MRRLVITVDIDDERRSPRWAFVGATIDRLLKPDNTPGTWQVLIRSVLVLLEQKDASVVSVNEVSRPMYGGPMWNGETASPPRKGTC